MVSVYKALSRRSLKWENVNKEKGSLQFWGKEKQRQNLMHQEQQRLEAPCREKALMWGSRRRVLMCCSVGGSKLHVSSQRSTCILANKANITQTSFLSRACSSKRTPDWVALLLKTLTAWEAENPQPNIHPVNMRIIELSHSNFILRLSSEFESGATTCSDVLLGTLYFHSSFCRGLYSFMAFPNALNCHICWCYWLGIDTNHRCRG